jgi:hypothetical protein
MTDSASIRRVDQRPLTLGPRDIICLACVRNENLRLPYFLAYHRELGVDRFLVIDNDSTDGTTEFLLEQPDVHLFLTAQPYAEAGHGVAWWNTLIERYGLGRWVLTVDADELLVYPECDSVRLRQLCDDLDERQEEALLTFLLDLYSDQPIRDTHYQRGSSFMTTCAWFDAHGYRQESPRDPSRVPTRGGPRERLFWTADQTWPSPYLRKLPLVRWRNGLRYTHSTHLVEGVRTAQITGALLHFKLFADFIELVEIEAERRQRWGQSRQYAAYRDALARQPAMTAHHAGSVRYQGVGQLVELGLMTGHQQTPVPSVASDDPSHSEQRGSRP